MWCKKAVKAGLLPWAWVQRDRRPGLFVLIYHRVGAGMGAEMDLPTERFEQQMRYLKRRFDVVPLASAVDALLAGRSPSRDQVAVTFDDGYDDVFTNAFPILQRLGVPSSVFVATDFIDEKSGAPLSRHNPSGASPLTWGELREMASSGLVTVESHTVTHRDFDLLSAADAASECVGAADVIEARTGTRPRLFAYPRAIVAHEDEVAAVYRAAVAAEGMKNHGRTSVATRIFRTPVRDSDGMFFFKMRLAGVWPVEDRLYARLKGMRGPRRGRGGSR